MEAGADRPRAGGARRPVRRAPAAQPRRVAAARRRRRVLVPGTGHPVGRVRPRRRLGLLGVRAIRCDRRPADVPGAGADARRAPAVAALATCGRGGGRRPGRRRPRLEPGPRHVRPREPGGRPPRLVGRPGGEQRATGCSSSPSCWRSPPSSYGSAGDRTGRAWRPRSEGRPASRSSHSAVTCCGRGQPTRSTSSARCCSAPGSPSRCSGSRSPRPTRPQHPRSRTPPGCPAASARSSELVAEGLTNRQIAERLFISPVTARNHVSRILTKLGLENRTQAATWLARSQR